MEGNWVAKVSDSLGDSPLLGARDAEILIRASIYASARCDILNSRARSTGDAKPNVAGRTRSSPTNQSRCDVSRRSTCLIRVFNSRSLAIEGYRDDDGGTSSPGRFPTRRAIEIISYVGIRKYITIPNRANYKADGATPSAAVKTRCSTRE